MEQAGEDISRRTRGLRPNSPSPPSSSSSSLVLLSSSTLLCVDPAPDRTYPRSLFSRFCALPAARTRRSSSSVWRRSRRLARPLVSTVPPVPSWSLVLSFVVLAPPLVFEIRYVGFLHMLFSFFRSLVS